MLETAVAGSNDGGMQTSPVSGPGKGLGVFDKKGELSRAEGVVVRAGGLLDVKSIGPHLQAGDVDFRVCPPGSC